MDFLVSGAELAAESGKTYLAVKPLTQSNVWTAVEKDNYQNIVVIKCPSQNDAPGRWPRFLNEMVMHELFKTSHYVRKQVDRIPPKPETGLPPMLVLEILETTIWQARLERPLSRPEIVAILEGILKGLRDVHAHGLVYGDMKMENLLLDGFVADVVSDGSQFTIKLGDLGNVMQPATGTIQPVAYRAPEIYFREIITPAADIWAVGLIYSHLLEAQCTFDQTGMYDATQDNSETIEEREQAIKHAIASDYDLGSIEYYKASALPNLDEGQLKGRQWEKLRSRGLRELDVEFLRRVMRADPRERPTAKAILSSQ